MKKILGSVMLVMAVGLAFSFVVKAQNQNQGGGPPPTPKETVPWNKPETPRNPPANAAPRAERPPLFFREEFKIPSATYPDTCCIPLIQDSLTVPTLELKFYGQGANMVLAGIPKDDFNPLHLWSGLCPAACAVTLRDKNNYVDLSKGKIRWAYKMAGFHVSRPVVKLADGTLLIGDHVDTETGDWRTSEFYPSELRWLRMDPDRASAWGNFVTKPDLSKVDEIGFIDMMAGGAHNGGAGADIANIEVYGKPVSRSGAQ